MREKKFLFNSLKYIFVSGFSKGFNYLILLYFAVGIYSEQYVTILLLLSLEQLLSLLLPLNNSNIIYSKNILIYDKITNKLISSSFLITAIYLLLFLIFKQNFYTYFETKNSLIFFSIFISILINAYMVYLTNYYKLVEEHNKALLIQSIYFISFISIIIFVFIFENKILAFFFGKCIGLILMLILVKIFKLDITKFRTSYLNLEEWKKIINLFSVSILGWLSGLGFMNLAKLYADPENLATIGYILNIWNVFLLISTGINSVYNPLIKKYILQDNFIKAKTSKNNVLLIYIAVSFLVLGAYYLIDLSKILESYGKVDEVFSVLPYTILIFLISAFYYVIHPFYLANDKFGVFNRINIISHLLWGSLILILTYLNLKNYIWFLVFLYFFKCISLYVYAQIKLMR